MKRQRGRWPVSNTPTWVPSSPLVSSRRKITWKSLEDFIKVHFNPNLPQMYIDHFSPSAPPLLFIILSAFHLSLNVQCQRFALCLCYLVSFVPPVINWGEASSHCLLNKWKERESWKSPRQQSRGRKLVHKGRGWSTAKASPRECIGQQVFSLKINV